MRRFRWFVEKVLSPIVSVLYRASLVLLSFVLLALFVFNAPALHQKYIRSYVGYSVYYASASPFGGGGTAFSVKAPSGKTYLMTNDHICVASSNGMMFITPEHGFGSWFKIIERSQTTDLCLIEAPATEIGLYLASHTYAGDRVQAVGHPDLMALTLSNIGEIIQVSSTSLADRAEKSPAPLLSPAKCDTKNPKFRLIKPKKGKPYCEISIPSAFFTNVLIQPGNSGSPLVDIMGDVVGVISGVDEYGWGVAVSLSDVKEFLSDK